MGNKRTHFCIIFDLLGMNITNPRRILIPEKGVCMKYTGLSQKLYLFIK